MLSRIFSHRTLVVNDDCSRFKNFMASVPERFEAGEGIVIYKGRNELRRMECEGQEFVVKSFHRPHIINRMVYGTFRPSKAKRSYEYAKMYEAIGVGTPHPVGYINVRRGGLFDRSYFVTYLSECPHVYQDLFTQHFDYEDELMRKIGRVTAILHDHGYVHKDYNRGNILFKKTPEGIKLDIIDLNRMRFGPVDIRTGCKNFERLPATPHMQRLMAEEYAQARGFNPEECFRLIQHFRNAQSDKIDGKY